MFFDWNEFWFASIAVIAGFALLASDLSVGTQAFITQAEPLLRTFVFFLACILGYDGLAYLRIAPLGL